MLREHEKRSNRSTSATGGQSMRAAASTEQTPLRRLYLATRSLDPAGTDRSQWAMRWKRALNFLASPSATGLCHFGSCGHRSPRSGGCDWSRRRPACRPKTKTSMLSSRSARVLERPAGTVRRAGAAGRRLGAGPGVACPKSRRLGCKPAALEPEPFPDCPPGPSACEGTPRAASALSRM